MSRLAPLSGEVEIYLQNKPDQLYTKVTWTSMGVVFGQQYIPVFVYTHISYNSKHLCITSRGKKGGNRNLPKLRSQSEASMSRRSQTENVYAQTVLVENFLGPYFCAFVRFSCVHVQAFELSPQIPAFTEFFCNDVKTLMRSPKLCTSDVQVQRLNFLCLFPFHYFFKNETSSGRAGFIN